MMSVIGGRVCVCVCVCVFWLAESGKIQEFRVKKDFLCIKLLGPDGGVVTRT